MRSSTNFTPTGDRDELGKGKGRYTLSQKILFFIGAFSVSFMVIYMVYYYGRISKMLSGVTLDAADLKYTHTGNESLKDTGDVLYYGGVALLPCKTQAACPADTLPQPPNWWSMLYKGPYNQDKRLELSNELIRKFAAHPPLDFSQVNESGELKFSYLFRNFFLPAGYRSSDTRLPFSRKTVAAYDYYPFTGEFVDTNTRFAMLPWGAALRLSLDTGRQELIICALPPREHARAGELLALLNRELEAAEWKQPDSNTVISVPVVDMSILKQLDAPAGSQVEERVKVKTTLLRPDLKPLKDYAGLHHITIEKGAAVLWRARGQKVPYLFLKSQTGELLPAALGSRP